MRIILIIHVCWWDLSCRVHPHQSIWEIGIKSSRFHSKVNFFHNGKQLSDEFKSHWSLFTRYFLGIQLHMLYQKEPNYKLSGSLTINSLWDSISTLSKLLPQGCLGFSMMLSEKPLYDPEAINSFLSLYLSIRRQWSLLEWLEQAITSVHSAPTAIYTVVTS